MGGPHHRAVTALLAVGMALLAWGAAQGLWLAPPDRMMGEVYRIMFVHVPAAWLALVAYTATFAASLTFLLFGRWPHDAFAAASAELGVLFNLILVLTGAIWGRPTWGVWWSWDPRLTTAAIMLFGFLGYLVLRRLSMAQERRAAWSAVMAILMYMDIPIVWYSVKWWNSLHQVQSSPATVDAAMVMALRINAFAFLFLYCGLVLWRYGQHRQVQREELGEDMPPWDAEAVATGPAVTRMDRGAPGGMVAGRIP